MNPFDYIFNNDYSGLVSYLENGNVNITDDRGMSLLDYAIQFHNNEMFHLLLKSFINLNIKDNFGNTCYHYAVINNRLGYLKALLQSNGNYNIRNNLGQTPMYLACLYGREDMVMLFLEYENLNMNEADCHAENVFMALVRSKNLGLIERLGGYQNFLEETNCFGQTPLAIAVKQNSLEIVKFLISNNAFVNTKDHFNETPLFSSYINENKEITYLLLKHGAMIDCKDKLSETIFDKPVSNDFYDYVMEKIYDLHLKDYEKLYPLHYAIYLNDSKKFDNFLVLQHINRKDVYGYTPLEIAEKYNNKELIKKLNLKIKEFNKLL